MSEFFHNVAVFGPLVVSVLSFGYLLSVKISHIDDIKKTLRRMDENIERKLDSIHETQMDHESRISKIEGKMNGR